MKKGEVWRVRLPVVPGHTQAGERPAIIMQEDSFTQSLPTVLIVPFTGQQAAIRFLGTLLVHPDAQNGLTIPRPSRYLRKRGQDVLQRSEPPRPTRSRFPRR